jgi:hypothetical protein
LDDPKFHVNTPPVFEEHMKLTWLISSKSEQYRSLSFITYNIKYQENSISHRVSFE